MPSRQPEGEGRESLEKDPSRIDGKASEMIRKGTEPLTGVTKLDGGGLGSFWMGFLHESWVLLRRLRWSATR